MAVTAPSDLVTTAISSSRCDISWVNNDIYDFIRVWRGKGDTQVAAEAALAPYIRIAGSCEYMEDKGWEFGVEVGLEADEWYAYKIFGFTVHPYDPSADSNTDAAETFTTLYVPSDVVALPISDIEIEVTFKDNSENEKYHNIQRAISTAPAAWVSVAAELAPNREFFRDGGIFMTAIGYTPCVATDIGKMVQDDAGDLGLLKAYDNTRRRWLVDTGGATVADTSDMTIADAGAGIGIADGTTTGLIKDKIYRYRVMSEEEGGESDWAYSEWVMTLDIPADPTVLEKSNIRDTSIQLSWTDNSDNETGFRIEIGVDVGFAGVTHRVIGANITEFLVTGLDPNTQYWFRVRAYNAAGNSGYTPIVTDTTLAAGVHILSEFEKWIRDPNIELVYLAEIYTKMDLMGFDPVNGGPTWKKTLDASDRGIDILEVFEDGTAYTWAALVADQLPAVNNFYFDYAARILYIRTSDDSDPDSVVSGSLLIEGAFWLYFSTHKDIEFTVASGRLTHYLPLLAKEDIPDITQEIKPYYEGSFLISSASIAFINGKIGGNYFFDIKYKTYTWENSKVILKSGKGSTYANFETILTSLIDEKSCVDEKINFTLRDIRQEMERDLILTKFTVADYPDIEEDFIGEPIPLCFGTKYRVVPIPINVVQRKYKFHDGRSKSVDAVYKNPTGVGDTPLVEDTDYFVDLQRSIITFERDTFALSEEDIIEIAFIGTVNSADEPISNGAEVFKYFMNIHYGLLNSELNLDSIYKTKYAKTDVLSVFLYKDQPYREIVRTIEHSSEAYTFQDTEGRLGLKVQLAVAESKTKYIRNYNIFNHQQSKARKLLFWKVNVFYNELPQSQEWEVKSAQDDNILYRYKNRNELNIYSYFSAPSPAQDLATSILALLNKETIEDAVSMLLFDVSAGDIAKFSRTRFYDADGTASEVDLRIIRISKSPASGQTSITAELV